MRKARPNADRPDRAFGYPGVPRLYIVCAVFIRAVLFLYRTATTIPGVIIVVIGGPVYFCLQVSRKRERAEAKASAQSRRDWFVW